MKFSYNWLKELSGTNKNVDEIANLFLTHSFEVEGVEDLSKGLDKVIIGEILTKEKHPDADRLNVATVNVGENKLQIVCGAGMVHQNVFEAAGYERGKYQGFAWGFGLKRLAMMKYKINDIRLFHSGDVQFTKQF